MLESIPQPASPAPDVSSSNSSTNGSSSSPPPSSRKILIVVLLLAVIAAGLVSAMWLQQVQVTNSNSTKDNSQITLLEQKLATETALLTKDNASMSSMSSSLSSLNSTIASDQSENSQLSSSNSELSNSNAQLQAIVNLQENQTLVSNGQYTLSNGQTWSQSYSVQNSGVVIYAEAFVPSGSSNTAPLKLCDSETLGNSIGGSSGFGGNFTSSGSYCSPQSDFTFGSVTVYVGWFAVAPGSLKMQATDNTGSSGTFLLTASLYY